MTYWATPLMRPKPVIAAVVVMVLAVGSFCYAVRYLPEVDANSANGPVATVDDAGVRRVLPLTTVIRNPAGLSYAPDSKTWLVSTDDRVFAELSEDFSEVLFQTTLSNQPLSIGDTEGIAYLGAGRAAVIGENGVVILMARSDTDWVETDRVPIAGFISGTLIGSAAYDPRQNRLYAGQKKGEKWLYSIDLGSFEADQYRMTLGPHIEVKDGRDWEEFTISGMHFHQGKLYAISEAFSSILVIDIDGTVRRVIALADINESAGISFSDSSFKLIGDAESYLPDPPIYVLDGGVP